MSMTFNDRRRPTIARADGRMAHRQSSSFTGIPVRRRSCGADGAASAPAAWLTAQIAACVRFWSCILRSNPFTWTFTVASAMHRSRAIALFEAPFTRHCRISVSRSDRCTGLAMIANRPALRRRSACIRDGTSGAVAAAVSCGAGGTASARAGATAGSFAAATIMRGCDRSRMPSERASDPVGWGPVPGWTSRRMRSFGREWPSSISSITWCRISAEIRPGTTPSRIRIRPPCACDPAPGCCTAGSIGRWAPVPAGFASDHCSGCPMCADQEQIRRVIRIDEGDPASASVSQCPTTVRPDSCMRLRNPSRNRSPSDDKEHLSCHSRRFLGVGSAAGRII